VCRTCGCIQKSIDEKWLTEIEKIYGDYTIYHQSNGVEQCVFDGSGGASLRSSQLLEAFGGCVQLPETGRMLDVGCGNGAMLRAFSRFAPDWTLAGSELSNRTQNEVMGINGVEAFYVGPPKDIPGRFDVVTMSHLLEHVADPINYLVSLRDKLAETGLLLIEVPDALQNPFDTLVADHATHFTLETLPLVIEKAGYEVLFAANDWIPKELTIVARKAHQPAEENPSRKIDTLSAATEIVQWLKQTVTAARASSLKEAFGIFGTSIASTWLASELGDAVKFFVDEDPSRSGKTFMGKPVYDPAHIPVRGSVFLALPRPIAESVKGRLKCSTVSFHLPPPDIEKSVSGNGLE
jgi:SAM-dependent methyltransferase